MWKLITEEDKLKAFEAAYSRKEREYRNYLCLGPLLGFLLSVVITLGWASPGEFTPFRAIPPMSEILLALAKFSLFLCPVGFSLGLVAYLKNRLVSPLSKQAKLYKERVSNKKVCLRCSQILESDIELCPSCGVPVYPRDDYIWIDE